MCNRPIYLYNSIEGQIRALADLSFTLHDYEAAASNYRLVLSDYKKDKALRHVAAASEMLAVCHLLLGTEPKKQDEYLDAAYSNYLKVTHLRHAVRATLLHADLLQARGRPGEAAEKLLRVTISDPNDLRSALMYEQAALSFLLIKSGGAHVRKYALHLVHAGHRFLKAGHKAHGLRCYLSALSVYAHKGWTHVNDHVYSALAKHSIATQMVAEAVDFYVKLLGNQEHKPLERQQIYLRDFIMVIRQHCPTRVITNLTLPAIDTASLRVSGGDGSGHDFTTRDDSPLHKEGPYGWSALEEALVDPRRWRERMKQGRSALQNLRAALPDPVPRNQRSVVVGEETVWHVQLHNPLLVPLELHDLTLAYTFSSSGPEQGKESGGGAGGTGAQDDGGAGGDGANAGGEEPWGEGEGDGGTGDTSQDRPLRVEKLKVTLEAGTRKEVAIKLCALKEGWVFVRGLRWRLGGAVRCVRAFGEHETKRHRGGAASAKPPDSRTNPSAAHADPRFVMRAVPPMPRLQVRVHGLPKRALYGELMRCTLDISNVGSRPAASLTLAPSHPAFFASASGVSEDLFEDSGASAADAAAQAWPDTPYDPEAEVQPPTIILPLGREGEGLAAGEVTRVPLWCRAARPGTHELRLLFSYTPMPDAAAVMGYRLCEVEETLHVLPSLRASVHMRSSAADMNALKLALQLDHAGAEGADQGQDDDLHVVELSLLSQKWRLAAAEGANSNSRRVRLRPGNKAMVYLPVGPVACAESESPGQSLPASAGTRQGGKGGVGEGESLVSTVALAAEGAGEGEGAGAGAGVGAVKSVVLTGSPLKTFLGAFEKRLQGVAYWNEQVSTS